MNKIRGIRFQTPHFFRWLVAAVIVTSLFVTMTYSFSSAQAEDALDIVLLIDSSGSMGASDPNALRVSSANYLLAYTKSLADVFGTRVRYAVASFDTAVFDTFSLTSIDSDFTEVIKPYVRNDTDFGPPLDFVLEQRGEGTEPPMMVFLFTDGEPAPVSDFEAYFADTLSPRIDELAAKNVELFVLALNDTERSRQAWIDLIGADHYHPISGTSALADIYHNILSERFGVQTENVQTISDSEKAFYVEPYQEQVVFSIFTDSSDVRVQLFGPDNAEQVPDKGEKDDFYTLFSITAPKSGNWTVRVSNGSGRVWVDHKYPVLVLDAPPGPLALNTQPELTARLTRLGRVVIDQELTITVSLTGPDQRTQLLNLVWQPDGRYSETIPAFSDQGLYTLSLNADVGGQSLLAENTPLTLEIFPAPELAAINVVDLPFTSRLVTVIARLNNLERVGAETQARLQVFDLSGTLLGSVDFKNDGVFPDEQANDDLFTTQVTLSSVAGTYYLEASLLGMSSDGILLQSSPLRQQIQVIPPFTETATPPQVTPSPGVTPSQAVAQPLTPIPPGFVVIPEKSLRWTVGLGIPGYIILIGALAFSVKAIRVSEKKRLEAEKLREEAKEINFEIKTDIEKGDLEEAKKKTAEFLENLSGHWDKKKEEFREYVKKPLILIFKANNSSKDLKILVDKAIEGGDAMTEGTFQALEEALLITDNIADNKTQETLYSIVFVGRTENQLLSFLTATCNLSNSFELQTIAKKWLEIFETNFSPIALQDFAKILEANNAQSIAVVYKVIESLIEKYPWRNPQLETLKNSLESLNDIPASLKDLNNKSILPIFKPASKIFKDSNKLEHYEELRDFLNTTPPLTGLPESFILEKAFIHWAKQLLVEIDDRKKPPKIYISPLHQWIHLDVTGSNLVHEEKILRADPFHPNQALWKYYFNIHVSNQGDIKVNDLILQATSEMKTLATSRSIELLGHSSDWAFLPIDIEAEAGGEIQIIGTFHNADNLQGRSNNISINIGSPYPFPGAKPKNIFRARPLLNDDEWESLALGSGKEIAKKIEEKLRDEIQDTHPNGEFLRVTGLRRVGKSSILHRINRRLSQDVPEKARYLCVYFDLMTWVQRACTQVISDPPEMLWRGLLQHILENVLDYKGKNEYQMKLARKNKIGLSELKYKIKEILAITNKTHLLLFIDEGDAIIHQMFDHLDKMEDHHWRNIIATGFRELTMQTPCVIIMAHTLAEMNWRKGFTDLQDGLFSRFQVQSFIVNLLSEEDTKDLVTTRGQLKFTDMGWQTFWRFTGGYPAVIHILGDYIVKSVTQWPITGENVKDAVNGILTSNIWKGQLDYLRYGFSEKEELLLKYMVEHEFNAYGFTPKTKDELKLPDSLGTPDEMETGLERLIDDGILLEKKSDELHEMLLQPGFLYPMMKNFRSS